MDAIELFEIGCGVFIIGCATVDEALMLIGAYMAGIAMKDMKTRAFITKLTRLVEAS